MSPGMRAGLPDSETSRNPYDCNMADAQPVFGDLIRTKREAKNWSQDDLANASGVSRGTISRWELGQADSPKPAHVRAVCKALGIDPRQAAVALGILTADEIETTTRTLDPAVERALDILEDPALPADQREHWIAYLAYMYQQAKSQAS